MNTSRIYDFVVESNNIENIHDERAHLNHAAALEKFLGLPKIAITDLINFVSAAQPDAFIRTIDSHRVSIGGHEAPRGSLNLLRLSQILLDANEGTKTANEIHVAYEHAHPFIDGNGRSGRALWLWQMVNKHGYAGQYKFLQMYYYLTLAESWKQ